MRKIISLLLLLLLVFANSCSFSLRPYKEFNKSNVGIKRDFRGTFIVDTSNNLFSDLEYHKTLDVNSYLDSSHNKYKVVTDFTRAFSWAVPGAYGGLYNVSRFELSFTEDSIAKIDFIDRKGIDKTLIFEGEFVDNKYRIINNSFFIMLFANFINIDTKSIGLDKNDNLIVTERQGSIGHLTIIPGYRDSTKNYKFINIKNIERVNR